MPKGIYKRSKKQREDQIKRLEDWKNKNGHACFRGGFGITTDGYVWIFIKGYNLRNQVKLHRYLMEVKIGRRLKATEIVHHINCDKLDNRIENLQILSITEHNQLHQDLKRR